MVVSCTINLPASFGNLSRPRQNDSNGRCTANVRAKVLCIFKISQTLPGSQIASRARMPKTHMLSVSELSAGLLMYCKPGVIANSLVS